MGVARIIDDLSDIHIKLKAERKRQYVKRKKTRFCEDGA
jgi:hypothetical protein